MIYAFGIDALKEIQEEFYVNLTSDAKYALAPEVECALQQAIDELKLYTRFAEAGRQVIKAIHSIPDLYEGVERGHLEFYIGRCKASTSNVFNRFRYRARRCDHEFGTILFRCANSVVSKWEGAAIKIIKSLCKKGKLCVANVSYSGGRSPSPKSKESVIYLTWRVLPRKKMISPPVRRDIEVVANMVSKNFYTGISKQTIRNAINLISQPKRATIDISWHPLMYSEIS